MRTATQNGCGAIIGKSRIRKGQAAKRDGNDYEERIGQQVPAAWTAS